MVNKPYKVVVYKDIVILKPVSIELILKVEAETGFIMHKISSAIYPASINSDFPNWKFEVVDYLKGKGWWT